MPFSGPPPNRAIWVEEQSAAFTATWWRAALSADLRWWPGELDDAGSTINRRRAHLIGRGAAEPAEAAHTLIAATVWGSGNRQIRLRTKACSLGFEVVGGHLAAAVRMLNDKGPWLHTQR
ncbi:hypothetical protein GCM10009687_06070 [Asanoa iriomotensis]|uniref:Uncharacterized protein n=2 Tax=Asanoa iriomotensis TaxID=234613 RepID=A0ABQ4C1L1_9ACTN|nr:hypothetical protein Air01nite_27530 [Asanoa iriomotensis]